MCLLGILKVYNKVDGYAGSEYRDQRYERKELQNLVELALPGELS